MTCLAISSSSSLPLTLMLQPPSTWPEKAPVPWKKVTLFFLNRYRMPSLFCLTTVSLRPMNLATSMLRSETEMPCSAKCLPACSKCSDDCSSALEGMQPTLVQVPPGAGPPLALLQASMHATDMPSWAARMAAMYPPGPAPMTTTSNCFAMIPCSLDVQQQALRIFQGFLHGDQAQHGLAAVDDAVVVRQGQVVDGTDDDLAVFHDGPLLRGVHAQDGRLRRVDDGRGQHGAEYAAVGDREGAAGQLFNAELAVLGLLAEFGDLLLDVG